MNKKELVVVTENVILTECWNSYIVSAVLSNKNQYSWYMERFIDFYVDKSLYTNYYPYNSYFYEYVDSDEVVEFEEFTEACSGADWIKEKINEGKYILVYLNMAEYLEKNFSLGLSHNDFLQDVMLFGYDNVDNFFDFLVMIHDELYMLKMDQGDFVKYYTSACSVIQRAPDKYIWLLERHLPLSCFGIKNTGARKINLNRIRLLINDMLSCQEQPMYNRKTGLPYHHGIKVYDIVKLAVESCETIVIPDEERMFNIIKLMSKLYESRYNFLLRMQYVEKNASIIFGKELFEKLHILIEDIKQMKNIFIKYAFRPDDKLQKKCLQLAANCKENEYSVYKGFYDVMTVAELEKLKLLATIK